MRSETGLQGKVTIWAGWLLGGGLLLALALGAMTLSTDGSRLKRLFSDRPGAPKEAPEAVIASYEPSDPVLSPEPGDAAAEPLPFAGPQDAPAAPGLEVTSPGGWVLAEVIGPSKGVEVLLDGDWKGVAPVLVDQVEPGLHVLTFQSGAANWNEEIRVRVGDTTMVACVAPDELISAKSIDSTAASVSSKP